MVTEKMRNEILEAIARGLYSENSGEEVDATLVEVIANEVMKVIKPKFFASHDYVQCRKELSAYMGNRNMWEHDVIESILKKHFALQLDNNLY